MNTLSVRMESLLTEEDDNQALRDMYPHIMEVLGRDGWDDPVMDDYNELDPRRSS